MISILNIYSTKILIGLLDGKKTLSDISFDYRISYNHSLKIINLLEKFGLVKYSKGKDKRKKYYFLTEDGKYIAERLKQIYEFINSKI